MSILRAILDNPIDIHTRLIYSDWLEDHEQTDRANFIRSQISGVEVPEVNETRSIYKELPWGFTFVSGEQWIRSNNKIQYAYYHNGFLEKVSCTLAIWQEHGPALVSLGPINEINITNKQPGQAAGFYWTRFDGKQEANYFSSLPSIVFLKLKGGTLINKSEYAYFNKTLEDVFVELSKTLIELAINQAKYQGIYP